jgi:hypothetical protein
MEEKEGGIVVTLNLVSNLICDCKINL